MTVFITDTANNKVREQEVCGMGRDYFTTIYKAENEEAEIPYRVHRRSYKQIGVTIFFSYEECAKELAKANSKRRAGTF